MSYILEALRRSEQERQQGGAPTLTARHVVPLPDPGRFALGVVPRLLGAIVVVLALALAVWRPWRAEKSEAPPARAAAAPAAAVLAAAVPEPVPRLAMFGPAVAPRQASSDETPREKRAAPRPHVRPASGPPHLVNAKPHRSRQEAAAAAEKPAAAAPVVAESPPAPVAAEPPAKPAAQGLLAFSELPPAIQQALPNLAVSGFVQYPGDSPGDADKRMVGIGDRLAQQGDEIRPGLKVEQIAGDRVIFGYKGFRFWLGVR